MKRKIITIFTILVILISISNVVLGVGGPFSSQLQSDTEYQSTSIVKNKFQEALGVAQIIGVGVAFVMLIWVALKFMVSSANDKAEMKKHIVVYVVGAVFLFGGAGLLQIIKVFSEHMFE